jgi:hypothetical protein
MYVGAFGSAIQETAVAITDAKSAGRYVPKSGHPAHHFEREKSASKRHTVGSTHPRPGTTGD